MTTELRRDFKGVWIKAAIWLDESLSTTEKCVLAEINSLDSGEGCYASNQYLGHFFGMSEGAMANLITKLRKMGEIETIAFDGRERRMIAPRFRDSQNYELSPNGESRVHQTVKAVYRENKVENKESTDLFTNINPVDRKLLAKSIPFFEQFNTPSLQQLLREDNFPEAWRSLVADRKERGRKFTSRSAAYFLKKLTLRPNQAAAACNKCVEKQWTNFEWSFTDPKPAQRAYTDIKPPTQNYRTAFGHH